jgi:hypothetical protein
MRTEAEEWCFRLMSNPEQWERWRYIDAINHYKTLIAVMENHYAHTPVTQDYAKTRTRLKSELNEAKKALEKTLVEYANYKKFKARTAISK